MTLSGGGGGDKERSAPAGRLAGRRVLLVEDDPGVRDVLERWLASEKARVSPVADAEAAWALVQREARDVDLVISDVDLPGRSGVWLAGAVRDASPRIVVILITGGPLDDRGPADLLLRKPFDLGELGRRSGVLLAHRRATGTAERDHG